MRLAIFILFYPFSILYRCITAIRNFCYDKGIFSSRHFLNIRTIVVGNLTVGGTGKTPHVLFVMNKLSAKYSIGILSRGYGRATKGFQVMTSANASPEKFGDEMMMYYHSFIQKGLPLRLYVGENRVKAIEKIMQLTNPPEVLLLDDGFQHRALKADKYILLTDYHRLFTDDELLPAGRLRESPLQASRADIVIVSKTPHYITENQKNIIKNKISRYSQAPVFFTTLQYGKVVPLFQNKPFDHLSNIILLTSIAFTKPLKDYFDEKNIKITKHFNFPDHYHFTANDINNIINFYFSCQFPVICTFKDAVKLSSFAELSQIQIGYVPIHIVFCEKEYEFWQVLNL